MTWRLPLGLAVDEMVENDLKSLHSNELDAVDRKKWRKLLQGRQVRYDESSDSG